jgi:AraC-like DNA-binding protein
MDELAMNECLYFTTSPRDDAWGIAVTGTGGRDVAPHKDYYDDKTARYTWQNGRVLPEYALVFIEEGRGTFLSRVTNEQTLAAGDMLILFPGVWHKYSPSKQTGWKERWILFKGYYPDQLVINNVLSPDNPVIHTDKRTPILEHFDHLWTCAKNDPMAQNPIMAAITMTILAQVTSQKVTNSFSDKQTAPAIEKAKQLLDDNYQNDVDYSSLAEDIGMSYRNFRRLFKETVGLAPQQYHLQQRINNAKTMLEYENKPISEIAGEVGFDNSLYFSRIFRAKTGISPSQWRGKHLSKTSLAGDSQ